VGLALHGLGVLLCCGRSPYSLHRSSCGCVTQEGCVHECGCWYMSVPCVTGQRALHGSAIPHEQPGRGLGQNRGTARARQGVHRRRRRLPLAYESMPTGFLEGTRRRGGGLPRRPATEMAARGGWTRPWLGCVRRTRARACFARMGHSNGFLGWW
jgi:hypothetical protein